MRSRDVVRLTGVTYRQLDYLTRHPDSPLPRRHNRGSGNYRNWSPWEVIRIALANHLANAGIADGPNNTGLISCAFTLLNYPDDPIPEAGWVAYCVDPVEVVFAETPAALVNALATMGAATVANYDLTQILGCTPAHLERHLVAG